MENICDNSDDFLIILPYDNQMNAEYIDYLKQQVLATDGLDLQPEKTKIFFSNGPSVIDYCTKNPAVIDYLGFIFDGTTIKLRPKAITKYYYRMNRKAKTIGRCNWTSPNGRHIHPKALYDTYSDNGHKQTFISYAKRATKELSLQDPETAALIKNHKRKIAHAITRGKSKNP